MTPDAKRRRPRRTRPRSKTVQMKRLTREDLRIGRLLYPPGDDRPPATRGDCRPDGDGDASSRPCPWVSCKHHMYLDVTDVGSIKINYPDLEPLDIPETCALDIADRGGITLEQVGELMNLTRERIRQIEVIGLVKLKRLMPRKGEILDRALLED